MIKNPSIQILELPTYLDVTGVTKHFSICEDIVWEAIHSGELKASKPGRIFKKPGQPDKVIRGKKWIVRTADVIAWFARWEAPISNEKECREDIARVLSSSSSIH